MIKTVKLTSTGYLVNGSMSVPNDKGNRHYQEVQEWLDSGGVIEPQYTQAELAEQARQKAIAEAKQYLASTDYKLMPDYDKDTAEIKLLRAEARETIRKGQR